MAASSPVPCQTVYAHNLNERMRIDDLRRGLYLLFGEFGHVLDVSAKRTDRLRGQAWIVMESIAAATAAISALNGFVFNGKPLRLNFAKENSDSIVAANGGGDRTVKRVRAHKSPTRPKRSRIENGDSVPPAKRVAAVDPAAPPNRILFVERLPEETSAAMLDALFDLRDGKYVESRLINTGTRGVIAFIEYRDEEAAAAAINKLDDFAIDEQHRIKVEFAKR